MTHAPYTLVAPCKINLYLEIKDVRTDGYHELLTLFLPVAEPHDTLIISTDASGFRLQCPGFQELENESNLLHKAWQAFGTATGFQPPLHIILKKRIPMGAGLGGGSTDAAQLLSWLNEQAGDRALSPAALNTLAAGLGADVPFFLTGIPAWAEGIGERLTPANVDLSGMFLVLVCPDEHVNTGWAYGEWDRISLQDGKISRRLPWPLTSSAADNKESFPVSAASVFNDFEAPVFKEYPILRTLKEELLRCGAAAAAMSGSGASLFGLFRDRETAQAAADTLRGDGHTAHINDIDFPSAGV